MALPFSSTIAGSLRLTATALETTAAVLRHVAGTPDDEEAVGRRPARAETAVPPAPPATPAEPAPADVPHAHAGTTPARGTRSQIADPKAARKARQRAGR